MKSFQSYGDAWVVIHHSTAKQTHGTWGNHLGETTADELQHGHLRGGVLHGHSVGPQAEVAVPAVNVLAGGVVKVRVQDLL